MNPLLFIPMAILILSPFLILAASSRRKRNPTDRMKVQIEYPDPSAATELQAYDAERARLLALQAQVLSIRANTCSDPLITARLSAEASLLALRSARIADPRSSLTSRPSEASGASA